MAAVTCKKPGRPKGKGKDPMRALRVPDAEWQRWGELADARGLTRSRWMRNVLNRAAKRALRKVE